MRFDSIERYSVFAINNLNMKNADCEGNMAVGKNITLENISIGIGYAPTSSSQNSDSLVIGGTVNIKNCVNYSGNTIVQKNRYPKNYKMTSPKGSVILKKILDFKECYNFLKDLSNRLKQKTSNALVERIGENTFELISIFKNEIQVFNLEIGNGEFEELNIYLMVDNRSPIIINVDSEKINLKNVRVYFNNQLCNEGVCSRIIWNFHSAEEIMISNSKFYGTILGVDSAIYLKNSLLYGSVYGGDIFGDSDVILCKLDITLCRYLNDMQNYSYVGTNVKLKNKFIDQYYSHSNTVTSDKKSDFKSQSISTKENIKTTQSANITKAITYNTENQNIENLNKNKVVLNDTYETKIINNLAKNKETKKLEETHKKNHVENMGTEVFKESKTKVSPENCMIDKCSNNANENKKNEHGFDDEIIINMLKSISQVEEGIAEILKAEAFKIKKSVELAQTVEDYVKLDESLGKTARGLNSLQSLLLSKFEEVMKICNKD